MYADLELFYRCTKGPDVPHLFCIAHGRPADRIATLADRQHIHLIVQGSRGRSGIDYAVLGSTAEAVVQQAPCSVLTVKMPVSGPTPDLVMWDDGEAQAHFTPVQQ
jgi:hypothetical protein